MTDKYSNSSTTQNCGSLTYVSRRWAAIPISPFFNGVRLVVFVSVLSMFAAPVWAHSDRADLPDKQLRNEGQANEFEDQPVYKYQANIISRKFHRPNCPFALIMGSDKKIYIEHRHQALAQGFKPCRYCLPPVWKTVHGRLLNQDISR